jgi:hypothetical protein
MCGIDQTLVLYTFDLHVYLEPESFAAVRLADMDLSVHLGVFRLVDLPPLTGSDLHRAQKAGCGRKESNTTKVRLACVIPA